MKKRLSFACCCLLIIALIVLSACTKAAPTTSSPSAAATAAATDTAAATAAATAAPAADAPADGTTKDGLPIVPAAITLKGFAAKHPLQGDWNEMIVLKDFEKRSNINITWDTPGDDVFKEKLNLKFASNDLPDFVTRASLTDSDISKFVADGAIIDLTPLIKNYAPNLMKLFAADPSIRKAMTSADGKIYSLPNIFQPEIYKAQPMWINKAMLDKMGLPLPTTTEEYYQAMVAYMKKQPLGRAGGVGYSDYSSDLSRYLLALSGLFGLGNKGGVFFGDGVDLGPDGKMRFLKTDPLYKEELQYVNKLWKAGVLDPLSFTHNAADWIAKAGKNEVFTYFQSDISFSKDAAKDMVPMPLKGPHGDMGWNAYNPSIRLGNTVFTKANKNPEATMRWFDYWFSPEGLTEQEFGIKDQTYKINADGTYETLLKPEDAGKLSPNYGGGLPMYVPIDEFVIHAGPKSKGFNTLEAALAGVEAFKPYYPKNDVNAFAFTQQESQDMKAFRTDGLGYIKEMETKFITGKASFDDWDAYVKKVKDLGLDDFMKIQNAALERYNSIK